MNLNIKAMATEEDVKNMRHWATEMMPVDVWIPVNFRQAQAFMALMDERLGWPVYSLSFNKDMNKVMKITL